MKDPRLEKLADILVNYSLKVKEGENVLIQDTGIEAAFDKEIIKAIHKAGGNAFLTLRDKALEKDLLIGAPRKQIELQAKFEAERMKEMDCYIGYSSVRNHTEWSDLDSDQLEIYNTNVWKHVHVETRLKKRWVVLRYPSQAMAQMASMGSEEFEDFYFRVCTMDYAKMSKAMDNLVKYLEKTDRVQIKGNGTDISFSIKGLPAIKCDGTVNIPDGEVFTAPVKNSVNGIISYNTPSIRDGFTFENIVLEFKDGKIIKATSNNDKMINKILDTDDGARYVGEFAFGVNPFITKAMKETLFDEKIAGSIHFTPGNSYDDCPNGNSSSVHWDLVLIQTPEYGGGEIYLDGKLVRKDGIFVIPELECLNPQNLSAI